MLLRINPAVKCAAHPFECAVNRALLFCSRIGGWWAGPRAGINLGRVQSGNKFAAAAADCKCRCLASSFISADYPAPVSLIQRAGF